MAFEVKVKVSVLYSSLYKYLHCYGYMSRNKVLVGISFMFTAQRWPGPVTGWSPWRHLVNGVKT